MTDQVAGSIEATAEAPDKGPDMPPWLRATMADAQAVEFEVPILASVTADCDELGDRFRAFLQPQEGAELPDDPTIRVFNLLSSILGMHFQPEHKNEPFGPMVTFADGRRSAIPEDFRGAHVDVLAGMADRATNPVLQARLCDVCWLLDRKRQRSAPGPRLRMLKLSEKSTAVHLRGAFRNRMKTGDCNGRLIFTFGEPCRSVAASDGTRRKRSPHVCSLRSFASARTAPGCRLRSAGFRA
jgi:hypothetical protein